MRRARGERGAALIIVLALVVLLAVVGLAMVDNALTDVTIASNQGFGLAATYLAEAGVSDAVNEILTHPEGNKIGDPSCPATVGSGSVTSTPAPVRALQGTLDGGYYRVCIEKAGTTRIIVSTGRAQDVVTVPASDDGAASVKTVRYAIRVIPSNFTYTIFALKSVDLFATVVGATTYAPVVIQTFPPDRPMAIRAGPTPANTQTWVAIHAGTQITGGLDIGGYYSLQAGATDPCKPTGIWECEVPSGGPTFPTFNVRHSDPGADAESYEGKARASTDCGPDNPPSKDGCYFSTEAAFRSWVLACPPTCSPGVTSTVDGRVLGPGVFFINATTVIDAPLNIKEIIGTFVIGQNNLQIDAGFTYKPCTDPNDPESCSEPALVVNKNLTFTGAAINLQCRNILIEGMLYLESQDFNIQYAPDVSTGPDCDAGAPGVQKPVVRFGMIVSKEDVRLHGEIRVEFNPALLDSLPPGLLGSTSSTPLVLPLGWMSK